MKFEQGSEFYSAVSSQDDGIAPMGTSNYQTGTDPTEGPINRSRKKYGVCSLLFGSKKPPPIKVGTPGHHSSRSVLSNLNVN